MKTIITMFMFIVTYCSAAIEYDDLNHKSMVAVLNDKKRFGAVFECIVDIKPCDDDFGTHLKGHVVQLLSDSCNECDYAAKHYTHAYIAKLKNDFPELYEKFEEKYDPSRTLLKKLDDAMLKYA